MSLARSAAVVRFEFRRTARFPRLLWWAMLILFPIAIITLLVGIGAQLPDDKTWSLPLFVMIPIIVCMMGLLLWATPAVHEEVEGNTWPYLAVRPYGRLSILLGKYFTAVGWSALAGWISLAVCLLIAQPSGGFRMFWVIAVLVLLSSLAYGSVYTFLGVVVHKKPMVAAVAYSLILEFIVALIPAMINEFTINMRLRSLLVYWLELDERTGGPLATLAGDPGSPLKHIAILLGITVAFLTASAWLLQQKTLVTASDS